MKKKQALIVAYLVGSALDAVGYILKHAFSAFIILLFMKAYIQYGLFQ